MNTAQRIEQMTDEGEFELLATAVLAKSNPDYGSVIHLGINASGKTVPSPVDGFCRVPGSNPAHFVLVQHTTTARSGLRKKWLSTSAQNPGDLVKAGRQAAGLPAQNTDAVFTVVLSTNQQLSGISLTKDGGAKGLLNEVLEVARTLDVEVDLWDQSIYARFLDTERDGQFLRWKYLGSDAQMLSRDLLCELSGRSLAAYSSEQFTSPDTWTRRSIADDVLRKRHSSSHLAVLLGESGTGKSAISYQALAQHVNTGGVGFWMPAAIADTSLDLAEAMDRLLHRLQPSLLSGEAHHLGSLMSGEPIVIVVDDVRDAVSPSRLAHRIASWSVDPYLIVMPMWPRIWALTEPTWEQSQEQSHCDTSHDSAPSGDNGPKVSFHHVGTMAPDESIKAIRAASHRAGLGLSEIEMINISRMLGFDPWCIGAWTNMAVSGRTSDARKAAAASVDAYVEYCLRELANSGGQFLCAEYKESLTKLATHMLRRSCIDPSWLNITSWFRGDEDSAKALRDLCKNEKICRRDDQGKFRFRHDRILGYFAVEALCTILSSQATDDRKVVFDPYYSWWTAEALLRSPQSENLIDEMLSTLPFAVTLTIGNMGTPRTDYEEMILDKVRAWVQPLRRSASIPESVRGAIANSFIFADSPAVLDIVTHDFGLEVPWLGDFACFRNGDAEAGVRYAEIAGIGEGRAGFWEQLVEHSRRRHRDRLVSELTHILVSTQDERHVKGALVLAGFLALPELHMALTSWWRGRSKKTSHLLEALWSALRCSHEYECDDLLAEMAAYWAEFPDVQESDRDGLRQHVADRLVRVLAEGAAPDLVDWLLCLADRHQQLQNHIAFMCSLIDLPDAIEHAVRYWAVNEGETQQRVVEHHWGHFDNPRLSGPSVERLRVLWDTTDSDTRVRKLAFSLWLENVDREVTDVLAILKQVNVSTVYSTDAVIARARMGDESCVRSLLDVIRSDPWQFHVAHHVWCGDLKDLAAQFLASFACTIPPDFTGGKLNEHYALADLLLRIPSADAESLLLDNWAHLRFSPLFVQSALFAGTPRCVSMADQSINEFPRSVNPIEHMDIHFGFSWGTWSDRPPLTLERLHLAGRYLDRLHDTAGLGYVRACCEFGEAGLEWARDNAPSTAWDWYRKNNCPTDADIAERLSGLTMEHPNATRMYVDDFVKRTDQDHLLMVLSRWLRQRSTATWRQVQVAAVILDKIGNRSDLEMLDVTVDLDEGLWGVQEAERIIKGVTFSVQLRSLL